MMLNRRFFVSAFPLACALAPAGAPAANRPPVVLFVCAYGTAKSAIARELFRRRAHQRGVGAIAFSRGLQIEKHVSPRLQALLDADGIATRRDGFAVLVPNDIQRADIVVSFARLPPTYRTRKARDWTALPSVNAAWPAARAELDRRIEALVDEIAAVSGTRR